MRRPRAPRRFTPSSCPFTTKPTFSNTLIGREENYRITPFRRHASFANELVGVPPRRVLAGPWEKSPDGGPNCPAKKLHYYGNSLATEGGVGEKPRDDLRIFRECLGTFRKGPHAPFHILHLLRMYMCLDPTCAHTPFHTKITKITHISHEVHFVRTKFSKLTRKSGWGL